MAAALVPDTLWELIEFLLPPPVPKPRGGRPCLSDRKCRSGIIFVLRSGVPWQMLPWRVDFGGGV
jgi:transposase